MIEKPFDVTKAVDFSDAQIAETWVDLLPDGFSRLADPRSTMPLLLLGGKGSGRTHLLRYYSYPVQKVRAGSEDVVEYLRREGYVGIYMRCEGLNAGRFDGKGQTAETWAAVFAYYMDLWLTELTLLVAADALGGREELRVNEAQLSRGILELFDEPPGLTEPSIAGLIEALSRLRRDVDLAVNNAALTRSLGSLRLTASRGRLVAGVPQALAEHLSLFRRIQCDYLIDELENLNEAQQEYVNTLIREKAPPSTFVVGSRLYGYRTRKTLSAGEENRAGSEYEQVLLDEHLRSDPRYKDFAQRLVIKRLAQAGYGRVVADIAAKRRTIDDLFTYDKPSRFESSQTAFAVTNYEMPSARPWLVKLRAQLEDARVRRLIALPQVAVSGVLEAVACSAEPLLEKTNIFLLYQDWAAGRDLSEAAAEISDASRRMLAGEGGERHEHVLGHFKGDLLAQLLRDGRQRQRYLGLQTFIDMSAGLPRHLLIVLKYVHRWAQFMGEDPFTGVPISVAAQRAGVLQAANWFFDDAKGSGEAATEAQQAVERLARLFGLMRFSDKPVESSLTTFSFEEHAASERAKRVIQRAHHSGLLLRVAGGAKDRNDEGVVAKYQLSPMLSPRFDLPFARRGTIGLSRREVQAIFVEGDEAFETVVSERLTRMNAPFSRVDNATTQDRLPGFE